jgi:endoribonuclease Dicer
VYLIWIKRTVFVVNNVPLVHQQADFIRQMTDLNVGDYFGDKIIDGKMLDHWDMVIWKKILDENQVLVMTGQILADILNHGFLSRF